MFISPAGRAKMKLCRLLRYHRRFYLLYRPAVLGTTPSASEERSFFYIGIVESRDNATLAALP